MGRTFLILLAVFSAGCTVGPNYKRPAIAVPASALIRRKSVDDACGGRYGRCSATFHLPTMITFAAT